jgi:hypothetical protein
MKRIKLKKYVAGKDIKECICSIYEAGEQFPEYEGFMIAGWAGDISYNSSVSSDFTLYSDEMFVRKYPFADAEMKPTSAKIVDLVQFNDFNFALTKETTNGTEYNISTTGEEENWEKDKHQVVKYEPDPTGENCCKVEQIFDKTNIIFNDDVYVYGEIYPDNVFAYADLSYPCNPLYMVEDFDNMINRGLPFAYLMEQNLNKGVEWGRIREIYGEVENDLFMYANQELDTVFSKYEDDPEKDRDKIYFNPFKLKNMYNWNWNVEYNTVTGKLTGIRDYESAGNSQNTIWLGYYYYKDPAKGSDDICAELEPENIIENYMLIERIKGLYKYKQSDGHKSNIYSIRIVNSGLNDRMPESDVKNRLRDLVSNSVREAVKKIAPASTQLWQIQYVGH